MSEYEPPAYEAEVFWGQVKRGISGLVLPENVSDPKSEAVAWQAWHVYLANRDQPTWHFDSERFGDAMRTHWPGLARVWIERMYWSWTSGIRKADMLTGCRLHFQSG